MKIVLRPGKESDVGFCIATWRRSHDWPGEKDDVRAHMDAAAHRVLEGSGKFVVACSSENHDTLVGWALSEGGHVLWLYMSKDFRGQGLGRRLHAAVVVGYTPSAPVGPQERE